MNLRNVLKTYSLLRSLTDDESALVETFRTMADADRELLVQSLAPAKPAGKKPAKKPAITRVYDHCLRCGTTKRDSSHKDESSPDYHQFQSSQGKSVRAASLAEQIKGTGKPSRPVQSLCMTCDYDSDHNIHHLESVDGYHPFTPPVPAAVHQSSANNGAASTASSVDEQVSAQGAAGGSGE